MLFIYLVGTLAVYVFSLLNIFLTFFGLVHRLDDCIFQRPQFYEFEVPTASGMNV